MKTLLLIACLLLPGWVRGQSNAMPADLDQAKITEKLGTVISRDLTFKDETGREVALSTYFASGKPVILNFAYYRCPMLCNLVLNGLTAGLKEMAWVPG